MSQAATTRQSSYPRNDLVFAGPIMPHPTTPIVIRSEAGTRRARANGAAETAAAAAADWMKLRRGIANEGAGTENGAVIGTPKNELIDDAEIIAREVAFGSPKLRARAA